MSVLMTPSVAADVAKIMRDHHAAVAAVLYGKDAVSEDDWDMAIKLGLVDPTDPPKAITEGLHMYGAFLAHLDQREAQSRYGTTLDDFLAEVERNPIPQTAAEEHAARASALRGAQAIVGLGNRLGAEVGTSLIEADRNLDQHLRGIIRDVISARFGDDKAAQRVQALGVAEGLPDDFLEAQFRSTIRRQVSDIGHLTRDWTRDTQRIVQTESHTAVQSGIMESWVEQEDERAAATTTPPRKVLVFKLPRPGACKECVRLHLDGGAPRIFYLEDLQAHGTNIGLQRADWQPVIGSTHPWCGCSLHKVPSTLEMPKGWRPGQAAPTVIGPGGRIVVAED